MAPEPSLTITPMREPFDNLDHRRGILTMRCRDCGHAIAITRHESRANHAEDEADQDRGDPDDDVQGSALCRLHVDFDDRLVDRGTPRSGIHPLATYCTFSPMFTA